MTFAQVATRNVHVWLMMLLTPTYQTDYWMVVLLTVRTTRVPCSLSLPFPFFGGDS